MHPEGLLLSELVEALGAALGVFDRSEVPEPLLRRAEMYARLYAGSRRPRTEIVGRFLGSLSRERLLDKGQ